MQSQVKVIATTDYYLPGFKGGGPIRTIANLRNLLSSIIEIDVFTRDRDLGSEEPYGAVSVNKWTESEHGSNFYATPDKFNSTGFFSAISGRNYNILYLNSFFSYRAYISILRGFKKSFPWVPVLIAPRGEFSSGALSLRPLRKKAFISLAEMFRIYENVYWHASTCAERTDILRQFPASEKKVFVAEDPVELGSLEAFSDACDVSPSGFLRVVFISRISPMKNLHWLLKAFRLCGRKIQLDIFGPIEDSIYWAECCSLIENLPPLVEVSYKGIVDPEQVSACFSQYDLFALPSLGENFGHVVFESVRAGTPVLVSDRTPWSADLGGGVTVMPISDLELWTRALQLVADKSENEKRQLRRAARAYAEGFALNSKAIERNKLMFLSLAKGGRIDPA